MRVDVFRRVIRSCLVTMTLLAVGASASAADRVRLGEGTATLELPAGWKLMSVSSSEPYVALYLCHEGSEPQPNDDCSVRAELSVDQYSGERVPVSLDARFAEWQNKPATKVVSQPRRFSLEGHDAIEVVNFDRHSDHIAKLVYFDSIVMRLDNAYFACVLTVDPPDYMALQGVLRSLCASIQSSTASPG